MAELTTEEVETSDAPYLIEDRGPGAPLVITFAFFSATNKPQFDFYGRLRKIEQVSGRPISKLLLRDKRQLWYLAGVDGFGDNVDSSVAALRGLVETFQTENVATLGQSMGGFAAILYGTLLGVKKTVAFGPVSTFNEARLIAINDRRWTPRLPLLRATNAVYDAYEDLPDLLHRHPGRLPDLDLVYGTSPGDDIPRLEAVSYDSVHAHRFDRLPNVHLLPIHRSPHAVVEYFRPRKLMTRFLRYRFFGDPMPEDFENAPAEMLDWVDLNLQRGASEEGMAKAWAEAARAPEDIASLFEAAYMRRLIRSLNANPPAATLG